ncbi:MAG: DUF4153 domain-containing protein [Pseudomonadota bacterium]
MHTTTAAWFQRPWLLSLLLGATGLTLYSLFDGLFADIYHLRFRVSSALFIAVFSLSLALTLERDRSAWCVLFSITWASIITALSFHSLPISTGADQLGVELTFFSSLVAAGISLPLFQSFHTQQTLSLPYDDLHTFAWSDAIFVCASGAFVGISFLLAFLLASLFELIGLPFLLELLKTEWFPWCFVGACFGASLGVLKETGKTVRNLQALVMSVLSILAPVLCISLVLFLCALPFHGLDAFWNAGATTPILLTCTVGAITLINAIIRNDNDSSSDNSVMRLSAIGLSFCILPFAVIAMLSMSQRIEQYGLTPGRIWGMISVLVAIAYGIAYALSLCVGRADWMNRLRSSNTLMAIALCVAAFFLALPILNFNAFSTHHQLNRIKDGRVAVDDIDYTAFAFDFGKSGRAALNEMTQYSNKTIAQNAQFALKETSRWELKRHFDNMSPNDELSFQLTVWPKQTNASAPKQLIDLIAQGNDCVGTACTLIWTPNKPVAHLLSSNCDYSYNRYGTHTRNQTAFTDCVPTHRRLNLHQGKWNFIKDRPLATQQEQKQAQLDEQARIENALKDGRIEIKPIQKKAIYIDGTLAVELD